MKKSVIFTVDDDEFKNLVTESTSYKQILEKLELSTGGSSNYQKLKERITLSNLDCSHFTNKNFSSKEKSLNEVLVENSSYSRTSLKKKLLKNKILDYKCSICGIKDWNEKPISLQLDHINGIYNDNRIENLRLLCPNCHSQTENYSGKNAKRKKRSKTCKCGIEISKSKRKCKECKEACLRKTDKKISRIYSRKVEWPLKEELEKMLWDSPTIYIARKYNVSDKSVEKWCKAYGLTKPPRGYWQKMKKCQ